MSKVICDICGTVYPESSENCPICGCSRDFGMEDYEEELLMDSVASGMGADNRQAGKKKSREIFDFDEVNQDEEEEEAESEDESYAEEPRSNVGLVVVLLILIVLLLATAGFFFLRYFLPNMVKETQPTETTVQTVPVETEPVATTEAGIPCTNIVIPGGKIELGKDGLWLMNVHVYPEDTTDTLTYVSSDEAIVTVSEDGTVKAVGEGQTTILVTCGEMQIKCNVTVDYSLVDVTEATGALPEMQAEETEADSSVETTDATEATGETKATEATAAAEETTAATEAPKETTGNMQLKLKKSDITMFARYSSVTMELDCDIPVEDIEWYTMDSTVAIVIDGVVTATGSGITRIHAKYGSEDVECIVRCQF